MSPEERINYCGLSPMEGEKGLVFVTLPERGGISKFSTLFIRFSCSTESCEYSNKGIDFPLGEILLEASSRPELVEKYASDLKNPNSLLNTELKPSCRLKHCPYIPWRKNLK